MTAVDARKVWINLLGKIYDVKHRNGSRSRGFSSEGIQEVVRLVGQAKEEVRVNLIDIPHLPLAFSHPDFPSIGAGFKTMPANEYGFTLGLFAARNYNDYKTLQMMSLPVTDDTTNFYRLCLSWFRLNRYTYGMSLKHDDKFPTLVAGMTDLKTTRRSSRVIFAAKSSGYGKIIQDPTLADVSELRRSVYYYVERLMFYRASDVFKRSPMAWAVTHTTPSALRDGLIDSFIQTHYLDTNAFKRRALRAAKAEVRGG